MKYNIEVVKKAVVLSMLLLFALAAWWPKLDAPAMEHVDNGMKRALVTFAAARALNAAISAVQGTELHFGVGVGVTLSVGEIVDPINDMVESLSDFMLMATVAFGIQKILLVIGQYESLKVLVISVLVLWGAVYLSGRQMPRWLNSLLVLMLMVRFAIPLVTVGSDAVFKQFLEKDYNTGQTTIGQVTSEVKMYKQQHAPANPPQNQGWLDGLKNWSPTALDPRPYLESLKQKADQAAKDLVQLIVVFLLQTLLIPLLLLWAMYVVLKNAIYLPTHSKE